MAEPKKEVKIVWRKVAPGSLRAGLDQDIKAYEFRYELSSGKMRQLLQAGKERETRDVLKWMSAYSSLQELEAQFPIDSPREATNGPPASVRTKPDTTSEKKVKITLRKSKPGEFKARLRRSIKRYEDIYEMESQKMLELLSDFKVRETAELTDWMFDYKAIRHIEEAPRDSEGNFISRVATDAEIQESIVEFKDRIRDHETRFNMSSAKMLEQLANGQISETIEIAEWKLDLREVQVLGEEIRTIGTPGTAIAPYTNFD